MIPKIIHYCWFGRGKQNELITRCIHSWNEILTDYKIILWNEDNFDVNGILYTKEAYNAKKYAFVSDYVRLYVLLNYGGIYLDTDVEMLKTFDEFLSLPGFAGIEDENNLIPACGVIGSEKGNLIIKEFYDYYNNRSFFNDLGEYDLTPNPCIFEKILKKYGYKNINKKQEIYVKGRKTFVLYEQMFFCPMKINFHWAESDETVSIHHYDGSWIKEKDLLQLETEKNIKKYSLIFGNKIGPRAYRSVKRIKKYGFIGWLKFLRDRK